MVDAVSSSSNGLAPAVTPAAENAQVQPPPAAAPSSAIDSPGFVLNFPDSRSAHYVLECQDRATKQVLVQVPMRSALVRFAQSDTASGRVGATVDTDA